ncbi:arsenate reductase family protein [Eubacteriaceae bacterium ES2]|nr:arsenate reductase family protein [Eubacteriaceae bacterium ES2]
MKAQFICYPKCTTCQKAKKFLLAHNIDFSERHIVEENPSKEELLAWMDRFSGEPKKFFNTSGMAYRELGLKDKVKAMTREEMADILSQNGMLVKRPILLHDQGILIGFKEVDWEQVLLYWEINVTKR